MTYHKEMTKNELKLWQAKEQLKELRKQIKEREAKHAEEVTYLKAVIEDQNNMIIANVKADDE